MGTSSADAAAARRWHLSQDSDSQDLVGAEFGILRLMAAFERAAVNLFKLVSDFDASFSEIVLLHVVRTHDRPKDAATIAQLVNRTDHPNVLYSLRKLTSAHLIKKSRSGALTTFEVTEKGRRVTDRYAAVRRQLLLADFDRYQNSREDLASVTQTLRLMASVYEAETRTMATVDPNLIFGSGDASA